MIVMSCRPGKVITEFNVPFPLQREPLLKTTPDFVALRKELMSFLEGGGNDTE